MKKIALALMVLVLMGCAELQVAADVLDILVPDDPCSKTIEATVEKAMVNGVAVYRVSISGENLIYQSNEFHARSIAAQMEADLELKCKNKKIIEQALKQDETIKAVVEGKTRPQWEKVK